MSLATRCTACGTIFRVVQDQLKVSEGWVRCGRCDAVFNALEGLFDLERDTPPEWAPMAGHVDAPSSAAASSMPADEPFNAEATPGLEHVGQTDAESAEHSRRASEADGPFPTHDALSSPGSIASDETEEGALDVPIERYEEPAPAFLRETLQPSRRRSSGVQVMMAATASVLLLGLVGQAAHQFRDLVAARMPALRPALSAWCAAGSCSIDAVRRIEDVAVETSALSRLHNGQDTFRLSVTLRNRGAMVIALPSIELSLTDTAGTVTARRSFSPSDFRDVSPRMQAGSESALQVTLATGNSNISGYTVEIFYP